MLRGLLPRLQDFLFVVLLAGGLVTGPRMLNTDGDLGRHLTLGGYILSSHHIPTHDMLSLPRAGESRPPYEWVAQVLLAGAYRFMNLDGVVLLASLSIALAFSIAYLDAARRSGAPVLSLVITAWAAVASSLHWLARPHVFSFIFFSLWLAALERVRCREKIPLWLFPAVMLLWANTHGGFVIGFLAFGAYLVGWLVDAVRGEADRLVGRHLLIAGAASLGASVLTPALWHNWEAVLNNRSLYVIQRTVETRPVDFSTPATWPFLAMLLLMLVILLISRSRVPASHLILLFGLAVMSLGVVRNIPFFVIAAPPLLTVWISRAISRVRLWPLIEARFQQMDAQLMPYVWSALAVLIALGFLITRQGAAHSPLYRFDPAVFPVQAADWVHAHPQPGQMFNDFNWGGYLLYRLWPSQKVFIDSQSDFYGEGLTRRAAEIAAGQSGWQTALDEFHIAWMLVPRDSGLAHAASASPTWQLVYQDAVAAILVRR